MGDSCRVGSVGDAGTLHLKEQIIILGEKDTHTHVCIIELDKPNFSEIKPVMHIKYILVCIMVACMRLLNKVK